MEKKSGNAGNALYVVIISGIVIGIILKLFILDILHVQGNSMEPTIKHGSSVFVNKLAYGLSVPFRGYFLFQWKEPEENDVVIYLHDNKIVVKRCVACSGTHLEFTADSDYNLILGGKKINLTREQYLKMVQYDAVPEGYILAIGDNYSESVDSRDYGFVSVKNVTGKIIGK